MWRKIHSNRDPRDTLYSELKKEFRPWLNQAGSDLHFRLNRHPKVVFGLMIGLMLVSSVLSFTVFRYPDQSGRIPLSRQLQPARESIEQLLKTTARLKETIRLKRVIDSLTTKKLLSGSDSICLDSSLDRLRKIHTSLK
jgi:hypothetical protein